MAKLSQLLLAEKIVYLSRKKFNEICQVYRCTCKEGRRYGTLMRNVGMRKLQKKARPIIGSEKQNPFRFVSVLYFDSDVQDTLLFLKT